MVEKQRPFVEATETSLQIVEALIELDGTTNTKTSNYLDMTKSTVYNHLQTLLDSKYIVKNGNEYDVGLKFLQMGESARNRHPISKVGPPEIDKLAQPMNSRILSSKSTAVGYSSTGRKEMKQFIWTHTRKRVPLHTTAFGKSILAHLPDERVDEILDQYGLPAHTSNTITDTDKLFVELKEIRQKRFAFDKEERLKGLRCVSAPILRDEIAIVAVSFSGPTNRMQGERFTEELPELVTAAANVIEVNMTYN